MTGDQGQKENLVGSPRNQKQMRNKYKNNRFLMRNCKKQDKRAISLKFLNVPHRYGPLEPIEVLASQKAERRGLVIYQEVLGS